MAERQCPRHSDRGSRISSTPVAKDDEWRTSGQSTSEDHTMPRKDKVRYWNRKDVSRWLEKRNLVRFVPLFLRNGIVGADLVESKLSFLYEEDVSVEDREQLLAEIYMLLHPDSPKLLRRDPPSPSLRSIHPRDREKYEAAVQVAKSPLSKSSSPPIVLIGSRSRSPAATSTSTSTSATTLTVPTSKARSRSESGVEAEGAGEVASPTPGRKYLKRKSTPAVHDYLQRGTVQNASLYETLQAEGQVCLHCVRVQRSEVGSKFGFSYQTLPDSCLLVTNIRPSACVPLRIGDRILEVNGILLPGHKGSTLETVLTKSASLDVVVVRHMSSEEEVKDCKTPDDQHEKLQQELIMGEVRWQSLRQLLTSLQHKSFDPMTLTGALRSVEDLEDMKKRATLEMEVEELQRTCSELSDKVSSLQTTLKLKDQELSVMKEQELSVMKTDPDSAGDTPGTRRPLKHCGSTPDSRRGYGSSEDDEDDVDEDDPAGLNNADRARQQDPHTLFFQHVELCLAALESSTASKEEVVAVLRELTQASRRQAQFLDRLLAFVTHRAPWMAAELHVLQEAWEVPDSPAVQSSLAALGSEGSVDPEAEKVIVV